MIVGNIIVFGSFDRNLYALDADDNGRLLWSFEADNWFWASPVSDGGLVFAASMDNNIYALNLDRDKDDPPIWVQDMGETIASTPFLGDDKLVVATQDGKISLLNAPDGTVMEVPLDMRKEIRSPLRGEIIGEFPTVYLGDKDGIVHAIDFDRWRERWSFHTKD